MSGSIAPSPEPEGSPIVQSDLIEAGTITSHVINAEPVRMSDISSTDVGYSKLVVSSITAKEIGKNNG